MPLRLGGIEGCEDVLGDFRRDALAVVGDDESLGLGFYADFTLIADAFDGVLHNVYKHLLEQGGVQMDRCGLISEVKSQTDVVGLAEAFEERVSRLHFFAQVAEGELRFGHFHHIGKACDKLSHLLGAFATGFKGFLCCAIRYFCLDEV